MPYWRAGRKRLKKMAYGKMKKETTKKAIVEKDIQNQIKIWKEFVDRNSEFKLNPDNQWVINLAKGVLNNEQRKGLKFCPCRITLNDREKDIKLICPCNFTAQSTWKEKGECWCKLFVKK